MKQIQFFYIFLNYKNGGFKNHTRDHHLFYSAVHILLVHITMRHIEKEERGRGKNTTQYYIINKKERERKEGVEKTPVL